MRDFTELDHQPKIDAQKIDRREQILTLLEEEMTLKELARHMKLSVHTLRYYLEPMLKWGEVTREPYRSGKGGRCPDLYYAGPPKEPAPPVVTAAPRIGPATLISRPAPRLSIVEVIEKQENVTKAAQMVEAALSKKNSWFGALG